MRIQCPVIPNFGRNVNGGGVFLEKAVENPQSMVYAECVAGPRRRAPILLAFTTRGGRPGKQSVREKEHEKTRSGATH